MLLLLEQKRSLRPRNSTCRRRRHQTLLLKFLVEGNKPNNSLPIWEGWSSLHCVNVAPGHRG